MAEKDTKEQVQGDADDNSSIDINADDSLSGSTHLNEPLEDESQSEKLQAELQESKDRYLRLAAEFENFKRRTARERIELMQTAGKEVIVEMLQVLDDSDRAQKQMEATDNLEQIKEGIGLVFTKLRTTLLAKGLKPMDATGKDFDADLHEAITEIPAPDPGMKGKVIDEVVKGYYMNDKILRHAKVVVGK